MATCKRPAPIAEPRRGLSISAARAEPYSREERDFINAFARALSHATAVVAADPDIAVPVGSIAHRVQEAYSGFRSDRRGAIQQRARERLSGPNEQRQRYFGAYWDRGAQAWTNAERGLGRELMQQLKEAVQARLNVQRNYIGEQLATGVATELRPGSRTSGETTLEVGHFSGDVQVAWTALQISSPTSIDLRWTTNVAGAERGVWQLLRAGKSFGQPFQRKVVLASGHAGNAPGAVFTIDLAKYLPSEPPDVPAQYLIRVIPGTKPGFKQVGRGELAGVPGKAVGPPSNDVVITYSAVLQPSVDFQIFEIYQAAIFQLESIEMIEDQIGSGVEEFHIAGFVQESFPASSTQAGVQDQFGPFYAALDPGGPRSANLPHSRTFFLNKPDTPEWPRTYSVVISVIEEDDGGSLNEWESQVWSVAEQLASGPVAQEIRDFLQEEFEDFIGDNIDDILQAGGQIAQAIVSLISGTVGAIVGMVTAAVALVTADIVSGMADDYYGTEVFVFVLPTNLTDFINSLPGQPKGSDFQQLDTMWSSFQGYTSWPEATVWDGRVNVYFHFEFFDKYVT